MDYMGINIIRILQKTNKYSNTNKTIYNLPGKLLSDRIADIFGSNYKDLLIPVNYSKKDYSITGYIGNIDLARKRTGEQYLYINNRFISNRMINHSI